MPSFEEIVRGVSNMNFSQALHQSFRLLKSPSYILMTVGLQTGSFEPTTLMVLVIRSGHYSNVTQYWFQDMRNLKYDRKDKTRALC